VHAVAGPDDLPKLRYLLADPTAEQMANYRARMQQVRAFADREEVLVQGWSGFGMDLVAWLCGVEFAVMAAMTRPDFFQELIDIVADFDRRRTEILLDVGGSTWWLSAAVQLTDFWSPRLFKHFLQPILAQLAGMAHAADRSSPIP